MRECEDSSLKECTSGFREKLTREKASCRAHDWKMKSHARLEIFTSVSRERPSYEVLAKHSVWQKLCFTYQV